MGDFFTVKHSWGRRTAMFNTTKVSESTHDAIHIHRSAYNAAFYELGLKWHWDANTYESILPHAQESDRIRKYLETHQPHLLKAYEADFLINVIQTTKSRCYDALIACGGRAAPHVDWAEMQKLEVGV
jgi:hypothetical protein